MANAYGRRYAKRKPGYKRPISAKRVLMRRSTSSTTQRGQIAKLAYQISRLKRSTGLVTAGKKVSFSLGINTNVSQNWTGRNLFCPKSSTGLTVWTNQFDFSVGALSTNILKIHSMYMPYEISSGDEAAKVDHTIVVMAPKSKQVLEETMNWTTGNKTLTLGVDYVYQNGVYTINNERWKIYHMKRTSTVQDYINYTPQYRPGNKGTVYLKNLNWTLKTPSGDLNGWANVATKLWPYYCHLMLFCFNNNSPVDLQYPVLKATPVFKCTAY